MTTVIMQKALFIFVKNLIISAVIRATYVVENNEDVFNQYFKFELGKDVILKLMNKFDIIFHFHSHSSNCFT
jgi:hypothetical protein